MGQVTSLFVHKVIGQIDARLDRRALLASVGLEQDAPVDPKVMVADSDYYALLERIARQDPKAIDLPLRVGASMRTDDYGAFGLAWKSALNLRGSFERAARYARLLTSVALYEVEDTDAGIYFHLRREGERRLGLRLSNEATIASVMAISNEVSVAPLHVLGAFFKHDAPQTSLAHERYFGCPVRFATDRDALLVSARACRLPNRLGDQAISRFFDLHLEKELARFGDDLSLERRVQSYVTQYLSQGVPTVSDIAAHLDMSARTLQRRLSESGHSCQMLVDKSRRELAERLLRETDYPLAEVAFLTGFSEQSAMHRAFRRWTGQTPRSFRLSTLSPKR